MTGEEAIKILQGAIKKPNTKDGYLGQALDMAIEALETEPCEDVINRKAAVVQLHHNKTGDDDVDVIIERDIATIQTLPPVTPKQKTGEWIKLKDLPPKDRETVLVKNIDGDVTCAYMCDDIDFFESFSGEPVDDVVEWREIPE